MIISMIDYEGSLILLLFNVGIAHYYCFLIVLLVLVLVKRRRHALADGATIDDLEKVSIVLANGSPKNSYLFKDIIYFICLLCSP